MINDVDLKEVIEMLRITISLNGPRKPFKYNALERCCQIDKEPLSYFCIL